jgi:hypothetical protein
LGAQKGAEVRALEFETCAVVDEVCASLVRRVDSDRQQSGLKMPGSLRLEMQAFASTCRSCEFLVHASTRTLPRPSTNSIE